MLEPLKEATLATNKDKYPTLSKMMPYYDELLDHFEKMEQKATNGRQRDAGAFLRNEVDDDVADAADSAFAKLHKYFEISSDLAVVATILDPRFKMVYYASTETDQDIYATHLTLMKRYYAEYNYEESSETLEKIGTSTLSFFRNKVSRYTCNQKC